MKRILCVLLCLCSLAGATTTVTGTIQNLGTGAITSGTFVRFWLRGCGGNQPRVNGTSVIGPSQGGVFFFDLAANGSGVISGTVYSTRDSTGLLGGDIECGGSLTAVWYGMQIFVAGKGGPEIPIHAKSGGSLDISNVTPITVNPVVASPTGDSTYARLDAGNQPFTGSIQATNVTAANVTATNQLKSTVSTGTAPLSVTSTTVVPNLNVSQLLGSTWLIPPSIGATTPNTGAFTTLSATGQITSTLTTGTSPFAISSTTVVPNLNVSQLLGNTWVAPGAIGGTTPSTVNATAFTVYGVPTLFTVCSGGGSGCSATPGDFTLAANTNLQGIPGLTVSYPANSIAYTFPIYCHLLYSQATAAVADQLGVQSTGVSPTNLMAKAQAYISASTFTAGNVPALTTSTATPIVTFTPSATGTVWNADIDILVEAPGSGSFNENIAIMAQQSNASDLLTIKRGSFCRVF